MKPISCLFGQHNFKPFEFEWVEEFNGTEIHRTSIYSKQGKFKIIKVYCKDCGLLKESAVVGNRVILRDIKT